MKKAGLILVLFFFYMNLCSAVCFSKILSCCEQENPAKSCCHNESTHNNRNKSCEESHLKYFSSIGQFSENKENAKNIYSQTPFYYIPQLGNDYSTPFDNYTLQSKYLHPQFVKTDIRTAIQSFQI